MPRPPIDLSQWQTFIEQCIVQDKFTFEHTRGLLQEQGVKASVNTIRRHLRRRGISIKPRYEDSPALRASVMMMFYQWRLTDKEMVELLKEDGITIGLQPLARLRKKMGLIKRIDEAREEELHARITEVLLQEKQDGSIEDFSREKLYEFIRNKYRGEHIIGRQVEQIRRQP